jgi:hypothetical protein
VIFKPRSTTMGHDLSGGLPLPLFAGRGAVSASPKDVSARRVPFTRNSSYA